MGGFRGWRIVGLDVRVWGMAARVSLPKRPLNPPKLSG